MKTLKRLGIGLMVAVLIVIGGAVAFAQGTTPAQPTGVEEVQFIGDPPGNDQTGEWEGDYQYEDGAEG